MSGPAVDAAPHAATLHDLVAAQAARTPNAVAVVFRGESLSYRALEARADRVASGLRSRGVGVGVLVGVALARSLDLPVAMLGVLKAGGAFVPLDPDDPREPFMRQDAGTHLVIGHPDRPHALALSALEAHDAAAVLSSPDPRNLAYILYTSGSTGRPKGVAVEHQAIVSRLLWMPEVLGLGAGERVLQKSPITFDVSLWEIMLPLMRGDTLVLAEPGGHRDALYLRDLVASERITTMHFVPSMLEAFLGCEGLERLRSLRRVVCSGEALSSGLQNRYFDRFSADLFNMYGPTEAAVDVTWWRCRRGPEVVPIGYAADRVRLHAVDEALRPVPQGTPGELCIRGVQLARGYWGLPERTAERFVADPAASGERMYRTGDRVVQRTGGIWEFLGRLDDQVKIRGVRVELAEVERALLCAPGVEQCAAVVRKGKLVAFAAPTGSPTLLRQHMASLLPSSMVPAHIIVLATLPRTAHGKVDRTALHEGEPSPDLAELRPGTAGLVGKVWASVLGCSITNGNDDFFDLGGDSLAAVRVFAALESALGIRLTHADLSRARSLAAFAQLVEQAEPQGCRGEIAPDPSRTEAPLSLAQQWIWMGHRLSVGLPLYHEAFAVTVPAAINPTRLERAIVALVARYPILRTAFVGNSLANTRQVLWGEAPTMLRSVDLENLPQSHRDTHARELAEAVAAEPFTLSAPPLVRVLVVRLGECESRIYLIFHHLIADAETVYFHFLPDLRALYLGHSLSPLPSSLTTLDLACHEQDQMRNVHADSSLSGILSMLEGAVGPTLPGIGRYGQLSSGRGGFLPTSSNPAHVSKLKGLANREGATLHMAVVAAFAWAIRRAGGPEDLVLVLLSAGREHPATAHVAGCFVNPFLVRISLSGTVEPETVMRRVRNACVEAYVYRDVPALFVAKALGARRQHGLFSLAVVMEPELGRGLADWSVSQLEVQTGTSKFDLCLQVEELAGGLVSRLEYRADVVGVTTAERVLAAWHLAVQELGGEE